MTPDQKSVPRRTEILARIGHPDLVISEFERFVRERPADLTSAAALADQLMAAADVAAAEGRCADALAYLSAVANWCESRGNRTIAAEIRTCIERLEVAHLEAQLGFAHRPIEGAPVIAPSPRITPRDTRTLSPDVRYHASQARAYLTRGDAIGAARHLTAEMAGGNPALLLAIAEIQLRGGRLDRGVAMVERAIAQDPTVGGDVVQLGMEMGKRQPDAGFMLVEMVADAWAARFEWSKAAAAFEQFTFQQPDYAPALVRLREMEAAAGGAPGDGKRIVPVRASAHKSQSA